MNDGANGNGRAPRKHKPREGSKLVRLNDPTLELLEQLRGKSLVSYSGLDALVYDLVSAKLRALGVKPPRRPVRGIPRRDKSLSGAPAHTPGPTPRRSAGRGQPGEEGEP